MQGLARWTTLSWVALLGGAGFVAVLCEGDLPSGGTGIQHREHQRTTGVDALLYRAFQRRDESGQVPENGIWEAKLQRDAMIRESAGMQGGGLTAGSWTWLGPGNVGGRVRAYLFHPSVTGTMWLASCSGGIFKTTDSGQTWRSLNDFMPSLSVCAMAMSTSFPDAIYAGTGEGFTLAPSGSENHSFVRGAGLFRSSDGGETWAKVEGTPTWQTVNRVHVHASGALLVAADTGLWHYRFGFINWQKVIDGECLDVKFSPNEPGKGVAEQRGRLFYTSDFGDSWTEAAAPAAALRAEFDWAKSQIGVVYAAAVSDHVGHDDHTMVYRSADSGQTWTLVYGDASGEDKIRTYERYNIAIWVNPTNANHLLVAGVNTYESTDGGNTFGSRVFDEVHDDVHFIVEQPGFGGSVTAVFFGTDGGLYRTANVYTKQTAVGLNNGINMTQFYGAAMHDSSGVMIAGAQDNWVNRYSGNADSWTKNVIGGDGGFCASDSTDKNVFWGESQWASIRRSDDGALTFPVSMAPPDAGGSTGKYNFIPYFVLDPNNSNTLLVGGQTLYRCSNAKGANPTWSPIKPPISLGPGDPDPPLDHFYPNSPLNISTIAIADGDKNIVWVGYNNGQIWKTSNGADANPTWSRVDTNASFLPKRFVGRIAIDPTNHKRVYVCFLGWDLKNVFKTTDAGGSWSTAYGSGAFALPAAPVSAIAIHPLKPTWVYAGTDIGVFASSDGGTSWVPVTQGPNSAAVDELVWRNDTTLLAVTYGRGIYQAVTNVTQEPVSPQKVFVTGQLESGNLQDLLMSDNLRMVFRRGPVQQGGNGQALIAGFSAVAPISVISMLQFRFEVRVSEANLRIRTELLDQATSQWVQVDERAAPVNDQSILVAVNQNPSRFIHPTSRNMVAQIRVSEVGNGHAKTWTLSTDHILWTLIP